mmetsp:Transcript_124464/g.248258  ORF Transcript_124464/g.248258 Transcript_124464/m.248258 type:complete len:239 (-) Transcript_124464:765-1481(-)
MAAPEMAAASVSPCEIRPAVPIECAEHPMATPRTSGEEVSNTAGRASNKALPSEAPRQPVISIDATASFGSHSGPTTSDPSMPRADITERWSNGKESGAGKPSGDCGATAPNEAKSSEKQAETLHVTSTHRKSSELSSQSAVVLYMRTPRPVTAAANHWKRKSPTPWPASRKGADGPTSRDARFEATAQITIGCKTRDAGLGSSLPNVNEFTAVLIWQSIPSGRWSCAGKTSAPATPR